MLIKRGGLVDIANTEGNTSVHAAVKVMDAVRDPIIWTILQKDGTNHLGIHNCGKTRTLSIKCP